MLLALAFAFLLQKNKNRLSPWESVFSGEEEMPETHQQKLTVGTELADALEHSWRCPWQGEGEEREFRGLSAIIR